jgi:abequosyltransferase
MRFQKSDVEVKSGALSSDLRDRSVFSRMLNARPMKVRQFSVHHEQIGRPTNDEKSIDVLGYASIAHLSKTEDAVDNSKGVPEPLKLSICLATYKRGKFIGETLESILSQMQPGVELVVVDGASPDNTQEVMAQYLLRYPEIRYFRESENSGIDKDYDKAVGYAKGEFCWLMTDDDLLHPNAIVRILAALEKDVDLVVPNVEVKNANFSKMLNENLIELSVDKEFGPTDKEEFFRKTTQCLSFIGCVVIRRDFWLSRDRETYYGTLFIHVGVIFQSPAIEKTIVIAEPLITIRYGNSMWTPRGFEIWMLIWPQLIWSFKDYSDSAKAVVYPKEPWRRIGPPAMYRALGVYGLREYRIFLSGRVKGSSRFLCLLIAICPAVLMNVLLSLCCIFGKKLRKKIGKSGMYSLLRSPHATWVTRIAANILDVGR